MDQHSNVSVLELPPREQMNVVLDEACNAALHLLEKNRELYPFAVAMGKEGNIRHVAGYTGAEMPSSEELQQLLVAGLTEDARAGTVVCIAIVNDVQITDSVSGGKTDAIQVSLEHASDTAVTCYLPYSFVDDTLSTREIEAESGKNRVFAPVV